MRLMMFDAGDGPRLGVVIAHETGGDRVADVSTVCPDLLTLIEGGDAAMNTVANAVEGAARHSLSEVTPALPIKRPGKFICVGLNYAAHAREGGHEPPDYPSLFARFPMSLVAAEAPVILPKASDKLDYEAELTFIIGRGGRHISEADGLTHVFGYTMFNDVSLRDYQRKTRQWTPGKNFDGTGPLGPVVVTPDELPPGASGLRITSRVNGETRQNSNTGDMIFSVARLIAIISEVMTLEPGDIIATGTPSGVAHAMNPPGWMTAGDRVEVEIEGIGVLGNPVVAET